MHDHPKHAGGPHEAYNAALLQGNDGVGGTSNAQDKTGTGNPAPGDHDDDAQVNSDLLNTWMQRLQVLTVVTTFLSSMDGEMFSLTALNTQIALPLSTTYRQLVYACLAGALIFHICASILGFIASFVLIRYRIIEDSTKVGAVLPLDSVTAEAAQRPPRKIVLEPMLPPRSITTFLQQPERLRFLRLFASRSAESSVPPPLCLLTNCYHTTLCLAGAGFVLALTGILIFIWAGLPEPVGIFSTVCLGIALSAAVWAIAL